MFFYWRCYYRQSYSRQFASPLDLRFSHIFHYFVCCNRSSHRRCSIKKAVLKNFTKFTGKHLRQSLFFNKVAALRPATLLKRKSWHRRFTVNFAKFLRTLFLQNTSGRLLLLQYDLHINRIYLSRCFKQP